MTMKLRFRVDQAESFRRGIDCPKSIVTIDVDPSGLDQDIRNLIADRLVGIDVCELDKNRQKCGEERAIDTGDPINGRMIDWKFCPLQIEATEPSFEALMRAIRQNEVEITAEGHTAEGRTPETGEMLHRIGKDGPSTQME
jgi:hypothetical protein